MVTEVLQGAFDRARTITVERASVMKWLAMAAASWLAYLGSGQANVSGNPFGGGKLPDIDPAIVAIVVTVVVAIVLVVWVGLTWVRSHGQVVFLDLVARDSDQFGQAWGQTWDLGNGLFRVRLAVDFVGAVLVALFVGLGMAGSWALGADPSSGDAWRLAPAGVGLAGGIVLMFGWGLLTWLLDELVVPLAYARSLTVRDGARALVALGRGSGGTFVAYLGVRFLMALVVGILAGATSCLLCAVAWVPFVSAIILLPFRVYLQSMPIAFLHRVDREGCAAFAPLNTA